MKLREWIHNKGMFVYEFAEEIGYASDYISRIMGGSQKPTKKFINTVNLYTKGKVTESDWEGIICDEFKRLPKGRKRKKTSQ